MPVNLTQIEDKKLTSTIIIFALGMIKQQYVGNLFSLFIF